MEVAMALTELLLAEARTRGPSHASRLEQVPLDCDDWTPHPKSMPLARLAGLVSSMASWINLDHRAGRAEPDTAARRGNLPGGHATAILRLAVQFVHDKRGLDRVLLTCDDDDIGSIKTIEKTGGVLEDVVRGPDLDKPERRYWIDTRR
jgi:hypothetical protein